MGTKVQAQVWLGAGEFALREFDLPSPGRGETVVEVDLATVCGSDVHTVRGRRPGPHPSVLGHEAVGRIAALGDGVVDHAGAPLSIGDRVVWSVTAVCGDCDRCRRGHSAKCRRLLKTGHEPLTGPWPLSGGYASHILLHPGLTLVRVPDVVPDASAAMSACALATVMACVEAAGELTDRRVVISGLGMLGLCACAVAAARGAIVEARDPDPQRRTLARRFGAARAVPPDAADPDPAADVLIELSGAPDAVTTAPRLVDIGGRVVLAGSVAPRGTVPVDPEHLVRSLITVVGVHNYEPRHLAEAVAFLAAPTGYDFAAVVAEPADLADLGDQMIETGGAVLRRAVRPGRRG
ncbi:alcohol dehydrogenase [Mycolicibacterium chitae]|uniref:alcohol dehydrogenase n=3 Tax=Mycolicibacterium chitae TaxID=1792 RepID=A0A3S4VBH7_MYCCI|nr:zinc-binding dehydrogenase [Mycolicibacterium chitae]BBZ04429.1 alcohol dehydrogenase [Mycolicibacterium chitae]VEG48064.1 alcohol dehydrogenase [Mycolicibacterium chitae]